MQIPLADFDLLLYALGMKRREALSLLAGSALAILPLSASTANPKRKTIYCMQNGKVRKVTGANPSCPVGWKKTSAKQGKAALKAQKDAKKNSNNSATGPTNPATEPTKPTTPASIPANWIKLTTLAALPAATATRFAKENVWVIKNGNSVSGFSGRCTHQGVSVIARGAGFFCPGHGATYDQNGQNPTNPASAPLARAKFEVVSGDVYLLP